MGFAAQLAVQRGDQLRRDIGLGSRRIAIKGDNVFAAEGTSEVMSIRYQICHNSGGAFPKYAGQQTGHKYLIVTQGPQQFRAGPITESVVQQCILEIKGPMGVGIYLGRIYFIAEL